MRFDIARITGTGIPTFISCAPMAPVALYGQMLAQMRVHSDVQLLQQRDVTPLHASLQCHLGQLGRARVTGL